MLSSLSTKLALRKLGLPKDALNFSMPGMGAEPEPTPKPLKKNSRSRTAPAALDADDQGAGASSSSKWPAWLSVQSLPLTVQPWLAPPPAPVPVAALPRIGAPAPVDRDRKVSVGGIPVLVVFLRCVGCAFAQQTFLNLRTLANRYNGRLRCIAVSHASVTATAKWLDLLGGAWNVQIVIDEDRAVYAAWGLGLGSFWTVLHPNTQVQAWKANGWLGNSVASYMEQRRPAPAPAPGGSADDAPGGPTTVMGNKWQEAGAFAVDSRGTVIWGNKAQRMDDVLDLDQAVALLGL